MVITQAYAKYNRKLILDKAASIIHKINGAKVDGIIGTTHNYLDFQDLVIRKGAIRSYAGELVVIPFNMRDGLAICEGKSNEDWNCSAPHGAGRIMSRSKAKQEIDLEKFKESMEGIYTTSVCKNTIDESPMAYKDMDIILEHIKETCNVLWMIKPVINIKSTDEGE
jgi:RNA-splicing ligase RtcB